MKLIKKAAVIAAVLVAGAGSAMATDQDINLTATVNGFCTIDGSLTPTVDTVNMDALVTTGFIAATTQNRTYAVICNRATDISLTSLSGGHDDSIRSCHWLREYHRLYRRAVRLCDACSR